MINNQQQLSAGAGEAQVPSTDPDRVQLNRGLWRSIPRASLAQASVGKPAGAVGWHRTRFSIQKMGQCRTTGSRSLLTWGGHSPSPEYRELSATIQSVDWLRSLVGQRVVGDDPGKPDLGLCPAGIGTRTYRVPRFAVIPGLPPYIAGTVDGGLGRYISTREADVRSLACPRRWHCRMWKWRSEPSQRRSEQSKRCPKRDDSGALVSPFSTWCF